MNVGNRMSSVEQRGIWWPWATSRGHISRYFKAVNSQNLASNLVSWL